MGGSSGLLSDKMPWQTAIAALTAGTAIGYVSIVRRR